MLLEHWAAIHARPKLKALPEIADISTDQDKAGLQTEPEDRSRRPR